MGLKLVALGIMLLVAACAPNVQRYASLDPTEKTMMVPPGSIFLLGDLKAALASSGWKTVIDTGPVVTQGMANEQGVNLTTSQTFRARYRLYVKAQQVDICITLDPSIVYDISVVDNKTGSEVVTMNGRGCSKQVVRQFMEELQK